jgi:hypothetical protein
LNVENLLSQQYLGVVINMETSTRPAFFFLGILLLGLLFTSCSSSPNMPFDAVEALKKQWESVPGYQGSNIEILRAWQGNPPSEVPDSFEVWCVEAQPSDKPGLSGKPQPTIWIVVRENQDAEWTSAMLMTMSAIWPYQACGAEP